MQMGLLLPSALLFPLVWGWVTYVVVSRLWPRSESSDSPATMSSGMDATAQRLARHEREVDSVTHNFQI